MEVRSGKLSLGAMIALSETMDTSPRSQILTHAQWFVDHEIAIVPAKDKTPIGGVYSAKLSTDGITTGYGIALGNGLIALDYDLYHNAIIPWESFKKTRTVKSGSGKGYHLYYKVPIELSEFGGELAQGITIRGAGSIVIGPGSKHPDGGTYELEYDIDIEEAPSEIIKKLEEIKELREKQASIHIGKAEQPERFKTDKNWLAKFEKTEVVDRSEATYELMAYSCERGATDEELAWIISNFKPAIDKGNLSKELARIVSKLRVLHTHPGKPCDDAKCPNPPAWMHKELVELDIWSQSPILQFIYDTARYRRVPPKALLMSVLSHIAASIPVEFVLPPIIGDRASLNFFTAFVGPSGDGKGISTKVAKNLFNYSATGFQYTASKGGSGEGLVGIYAYYDHGTKKIVHKNQSAFVNINEIDELAATGGRKGSTLLSTLREAWSGEELGHDYVKNPTKLPDLSYRLALQVSAQPRRSKWLIEDTDGGFTQRIVFVPTADPECAGPDDVLELPTPVKWIVPKEILDLKAKKARAAEEAKKSAETFKSLGESVPQQSNTIEFIDIEVCREATRDILLEHQRRRQGFGDAIDSQRMLAREKVAVLLSTLHGELKIDERMWRLSAILMSWSRQGFKLIRTEIEQKELDKQEGRATAAARQAVSVKQAEQNSDVIRVSNKVLNWLDRGVNKVSGRDGLNKKMGRDAGLLHDSLDYLVKEGKIKWDTDNDHVERKDK